MTSGVIDFGAGGSITSGRVGEGCADERRKRLKKPLGFWSCCVFSSSVVVGAGSFISLSVSAFSSVCSMFGGVSSTDGVGMADSGEGVGLGIKVGIGEGVGALGSACGISAVD